MLTFESILVQSSEKEGMHPSLFSTQEDKSSQEMCLYNFPT